MLQYWTRASGIDFTSPATFMSLETMTMYRCLAPAATPGFFRIEQYTDDLLSQWHLNPRLSQRADTKVNHRQKAINTYFRYRKLQDVNFARFLLKHSNTIAKKQPL